MTQHKKLHFNILSRITAAATAAVLMLGALMGTVSASETSAASAVSAVSDGSAAVSNVGCGVSAVSLNKRGDTVSVEIALTDDFVAQHKKQNVYLFALPYGAESPAGLSPITYFRATERYIYRLPLAEGQLSGIYNGYVIALADEGGYSPVGEVRYISDLTPAALYDYDYPAVSSPKGLEVTGSLDDALALNLSHAVVEVDMAALLAGRAGADTLSYDFNGRTAHIVASELSKLDDRVRTLSSQGVRVYLRLLPGEAYDSAAGLCSLLERRADEVGALLHLLATRYTDPDAPHGFAGSMIVGRDANLPAREEGVSMTVNEYMTAYTRLCRMANAALTSVYSEGRVYIAPSNNLSSVPEGYDTSATSLQDFLSLFNERTARGGDYLWGVAASAYAYSLSDTSIWDDALATGASTQLISPANIGVLTSLIHKNYNYNATVRRPIIVGAFSVPGTGSETSEREQATSLAYAYYKILENGNVDALIWGEQTDPTVSDDGAARLTGHGLSVADLSGNILSHRQAWEVMAVIDTDCAGRLPALIDGIGLGGVVDYVYGTQSTAAQTKVYITGTGGAVSSREGLKLYTLLDFSTGSRGGTELYGLGYAASPSLLADGAASSALELTSGATLACYNLKRNQLTGKHRLIVTLAQCTSPGTLVLTLSQGDARRYRAEVRIERGARDISFDIKAFCSDLDSGDVTLTLSVHPDGEGIYSLSELSGAKVTTAAPVVWVAIFVILVTAAVIVILLMFNGGFHAHRRRVARARRASDGRDGDGDDE